MSDSNYIWREKYFQELKNSISNSTLIRIKGAGHFPYMESPKEFLNAIKTFFGKRE